MILLPSYITTIYRATTLTGAAHSHKKKLTLHSLERFPCDGTRRHPESAYWMVPSGSPIRVAGGMRLLWPFTQHRPGPLLLSRVLANHPPVPATSLCPLRSAVCLTGSHCLYTGPSMPALSGTATGLSTSLDPLSLPSATARRHLLVQVSRQTYNGQATRTPDDQRPTK